MTDGAEKRKCIFCGKERPAFAESGVCNECEAESEAEYRAERKAQRKRELDERFPQRVMSSKLPCSLRGVDYPDNCPPAAVAWGEAKLAGLCLTGVVGVGKTHLAAAATWRRLALGPVRWVRVAQLMTQLRASYGDSAKEEATSVIAGTGPVVLDDLDKVNPTEFGREVLFCAIDGRVQEGAPLLVTTNLPLSAIADRLGDPIASRLAGYCDVVRMTGRDQRLS